VTELLLDTHIWFWYLIGSDRLPTGLRNLLDTPQQVSWLSPISVWEVGMLAARGRIQLHAELRQWMVQARQQFPLQDALLNLEVALTSRDITLPHRDPADHFIAATAIVYNLTLLTVDQHLTRAEWLPTRSE
jgi:PIN domain nuclease of toxin-antitoxin system